MEQAKIRAIQRYLKKYNLEHVDVQAELVDHFASALEEIEKDRPDIGFKAALMTAHRRFGGRKGFDKYRAEAEERVRAKVWRAVGAALLSFLAWPYFLLLVGAFIFAITFSYFYDYNQTFFLVTMGVYLLEVVFLYIKTHKSPYFLVQRSFLKLLHLLIYFPYLMLVGFGQGKSMAFWLEVTIIGGSVVLAAALWQIPHQLHRQAEREYSPIMKST